MQTELAYLLNEGAKCCGRDCSSETFDERCILLQGRIEGLIDFENSCQLVSASRSQLRPSNPLTFVAIPSAAIQFAQFAWKIPC